ncbi:TetR/AcrR family transcriptional regulator [Thalassospira indica]|uniref:TetR/AcrR family transcriptional regulator n=1 Tax=Thalassospira indica TaxID=1891279 RepID=A0ABM6XXG0_9PROT|nr:TetR/AcrR family transcriptional regulator [Thalassospira indica]AXO14314.1 TetR/AcrR family transcriptional regulator [Thalassospira indica]OAZ09262.1 TetR family transcriptional regulator [Thalassospira profundimaris]
MTAKTRAEKMEETRIKLIKAGRKAFAEKGYAEASMDELTASAGLTRGALYHNFGDKRGLLAAVVDEIDSAMAQQAKDAGDAAGGGWNGLMAEGRTYIELALDPEIQRIVLRDGPAFLGDPSQWPSQNRCLQATIATLTELADQGAIKPVDIEALARLLNGVALNAALWVAASDDPKDTLGKAIAAFECLAAGVLVTPNAN